jgi:hypothetical protein
MVYSLLSQPTSFFPLNNNLHGQFLFSRFRRMNFYTFDLLIISFSLIIINCGLDIEDPTPPPAPEWVHKSLPEEWPESGIDAHESGGIFLEWSTSRAQDIATYIIYRAEFLDVNDSLSDYIELLRIVAGNTSGYSHIDATVSTLIKYYYKLRVEDSSGNLSSFSDSIGFSLLPQISLATMSPNGLSDTLGADQLLKWEYTFSDKIVVEIYCLTVTDQNNYIIFREVFNPGNYVDGLETRKVLTNNILVPGQIYKWRIDTGAIYKDGLETAASESEWASFLFSGY